MQKLPHGWTESYTIRYLLNEIEQINEKFAFLEAEIARLDAEKQSKRGPKRKPIAQGEVRVSGVTQ